MVSRASLPVLRYTTVDLKVPPTELTQADLWTLHLPSCRRHGKTCDLVLATTGVRWLQLGEDAVPFETTTKRVQAHLKSICGHSARRNFQRDGESEDAVDLAELPFRLRPATPPPPSSRAAAAPHAEASEPGASGATIGSNVLFDADRPDGNHVCLKAARVPRGDKGRAAPDAARCAARCARAMGAKSQALADAWVTPRATLVARALLRRRPKPSVEAIMRAIGAARVAGDAAEAARVAAGPPVMTAKTSSRHGDAGAPPDLAEREAARLAEDDARDAASKRVAQERLIAEGRADKAGERDCAYRNLADDLNDIENRALAVARERRTVLLKINAARKRDAAEAATPRRTGRTAGAEKHKRDARYERSLQRTPAPTSAAYGDFDAHARPEHRRRPPAAPSVRISSFKSAMPGFDSGAPGKDEPDMPPRPF